MSEQEWLDIFADNLVELMQEVGYNSALLAKDTGLSEGTISSYINKKKMPGVRAIINLGLALNVDLDNFIFFGDRIIG